MSHAPEEEPLDDDHAILFADEAVTTPAQPLGGDFRDAPDNRETFGVEVKFQDDNQDAGQAGDAAQEPADRPKHRRTKNTRTPHSVTTRSATSRGEHFWLIHHQVQCAAHIRAFDTIESLAARARELMSTVPTKEQLEALARGGDRQPADVDMSPLRALNVRRGGMRKRGSGRSSSSSSRSTKSSKSTKETTESDSDSSSTSDSSDDTLTQSFWLDVQSTDPDQLRKVLRLFPVHQLTTERVLGGDALEVDNVEVFTSLNYVSATLSCKAIANAPTEETFNGSFAFCEDETEIPVPVSIFAFEDWIVTIHPAPFVGMTELLKRIQAHFNNKKRLSSLQGTMVNSSLLGLGLQASLMTPAWVLSTLVDFVVESFLPDPTKVLAEVDSVDEMVLIIAPDSHSDQADLLKRIAVLRRRISSQRAYLFRKEQLVQQLLMPSMRSTFVTRHASIAERYKHTLAQIGHVAERLDAARDILNQANSNFVSGVSMSMSQASTRMNLKMQLLSQVATICLPLNLVAGIFGMNVDVPYSQADGYTSLTPFFVIVGCMACWLLLMSPPLIRTFIKMRREKILMRKAAQL